MLTDLIVSDIFEAEFNGLFGANEIMEMGWGYVMPRLAKEVLYAIKKHLGKETTCFPSEDYLMFCTGIKKKEDIEASIQFLQLIGFIYCKHGNYKRNINNKYSINKLYAVSALQNKTYVYKIVAQVLKRKFNRKSEKDTKLFNNSIESIKKYLDKIDNISKLTFFIKVGRWEFVDNRKTLDLIEEFLQNIYTIIKITTIDDLDYYNKLWDLAYTEFYKNLEGEEELLDMFNNKETAINSEAEESDEIPF